MSKLVKDDQWVWVVIQDPGESEQFLGQHDTERDVSFIPTFLEKEEAEKGLELLQREEGRKYEVQAILFEDLFSRASDNGFMIFILNRSGNVLDKIKT
jgi:hypothetical protein